MRKMSHKRARPVTENDMLEILHNWFKVFVGRQSIYEMASDMRHEFYSEFYQWANACCEGRWYICREGCGVEQGDDGVVYFQNGADKVKFILTFM